MRRVLNVAKIIKFLSLLQFHFDRSSFVSRKTALIEKKLGMPARPKRPLMPFIRFSMEMRATQNFANRNAADVFVDLGALWKNADDAKKAIYKLEYQKEWVIIQ